MLISSRELKVVIFSFLLVSSMVGNAAAASISAPDITEEPQQWTPPDDENETENENKHNNDGGRGAGNGGEKGDDDADRQGNGRSGGPPDSKDDNDNNGRSGNRNANGHNTSSEGDTPDTSESGSDNDPSNSNGDAADGRNNNNGRTGNENGNANHAGRDDAGESRSGDDTEHPGNGAGRPDSANDNSNNENNARRGNGNRGGHGNSGSGHSNNGVEGEPPESPRNEPDIGSIENERRSHGNGNPHDDGFDESDIGHPDEVGNADPSPNIIVPVKPGLTAPRGPDATLVPSTERDAAALREEARNVLSDTEFPGNSDQKQRLLSMLAEGDENYIDRNRVDNGRVFDSDSQIATRAYSHAPNASAYLVAADGATAATAIADLERVQTEFRERNISYDEEAVAAELRAARRSFERGERLRSNPGNPVAALNHYRRGWAHAQRGLDIMDEAVTPRVTIEERDDMPHNDTINRTVSGTIFDVRGYELTATFAKNGEKRPLGLVANTTPGTVVHFNTSAELRRQYPPDANRTYVLNVSARDGGKDYAPTAIDDFDPIHSEQVGIDPLRLDADGLPDRYEELETRTDPLNHDSNSSRSTGSNTNDGIADGIEDFDSDGAMSYTEYLYGTGPHNSDTDGDELTDGFELDVPGLDPLAADSDGDDTPDGLEDPDGDDLVNRDEEDNRTAPHREDTDFDGLNDSAEIEHQTDPLSTDTDGDGLTDSEEIDLGTNPRSPDSDDDGNPDGEETFTTTAVNESHDITVDVTGSGNVADSVEIRNGSNPVYTDAPVAETFVSDPVDISTENDFESATLTFRYDESVDNESEIAVYRYDPENVSFVRTDSTVDPENNTVTATTPHFSEYVARTTGGSSNVDLTEPLPGKLEPTQVVATDPVENFDGWNCTSDADCDTRTNFGVVSTESSDSNAEISQSLSDDGSNTFDVAPLSISEVGNYAEDDGCEDGTICTKAYVPAPDGGSDGDGDDNDDGGDVCTNYIPKPTPGGGGGGGDGCNDDGDSGNDGDDGEICTAVNIPAPDSGDSGCDGGSDGGNDGSDGGDDGGDVCVAENIPAPDSGSGGDSGGNDSEGNESDDSDEENDCTGNDPLYWGQAERTYRVGPDAEQLEVTATVGGDTGPRGSVEIYAESGGNRRTLLELDANESSSLQSETVTITGLVDETATVTVSVSGKSEAYIGDVRATVARDSDGDGLSNALESRDVRTGTHERLPLDPYAADTDGDGVPDNEEVDGYVTADEDPDKTWAYYTLNSDPTETDSDYDGLSDEKERESHQIRHTDNVTDTAEVLVTLENEEVPSEDRFAFSTATSDPMDPDTDSDGLDDGQEFEYGTHPRRTDTDGDRIADKRELEGGQAPTLFDAAPPEIDVQETDIESIDDGAAEINLQFLVDDPSGVGPVLVTKDGDERYSDENAGYPQYSGHDVTVHVGTIENLEDNLIGSRVSIRAEDRHGNVKQQVALERTNYFGHLAQEMGEEGIRDPNVSKDLGRLSGFASGAGETVEMARALADDPLGFLDSIKQLIGLLDELGLLEELIRQLPEAIDRQQRLNNPYDQDTETELYDEYRRGWYEGYVAYTALSMYYGGQAASAAKNSDRLSSLVDTVDRGGHLRRTYSVYQSGRATVTAPARRTAGYLARGLASGGSLGVSAAGRLFTGARTVGKQVDMHRQMRRIDDRKIQRLSDDNQERFGKFLSETGPDGARLARQLDREELDNLLSTRSICRVGAFGTFSGTSDCVDLEIGHHVARSDLSVSQKRQFVNRLDDLSNSQQRHVNRLLDEGGDDGIRLVNRADADAIENFGEGVREGTIDAPDLQRTNRLLDGDSEHLVVGDDVEAGDLAHLARNQDADLSSTRLVMKPTDPDISKEYSLVWMERGTVIRDGSGAGWSHSTMRHMWGHAMDQKSITGFWPMGQTIKGRQLPRELALDKNEIMRITQESIENGYKTGGGIRYEYNQHGIDIIEIRLETTGEIKTVIPDSGDNVKQWLGNENDWLDNIQ